MSMDLVLHFAWEIVSRLTTYNRGMSRPPWRLAYYTFGADGMGYPRPGAPPLSRPASGPIPERGPPEAQLIPEPVVLLCER